MNANSWLKEISCLSMNPGNECAEFLLGRKLRPIPLDVGLPALRGKTALVTGAGGFIGAAICRTLANSGARLIVAIDIAEGSLARLIQEWHHDRFPTRLAPELCDIRELDRFREILRAYRPSHIYHAAAHKHVPVLEALPFAAIENNSLATWHIARLAADAAVERFVLISSDKAAAAVNMLGISKRFAEVFLTGMVSSQSRFTALRCGNVLGSPGSVLPGFVEQILRGAPLTVCNADAERYFMTVEEAAPAVLLAGCITRGADIFVPDMGSPVRIVDLAMRLVSRMPDDVRDKIKLCFTGLRPGDQIKELLFSKHEQASPSDYAGLFAIQPRQPLELDLNLLASELSECCRRRDLRALYNSVRRFRGLSRSRHHFQPASISQDNFERSPAVG